MLQTKTLMELNEMDSRTIQNMYTISASFFISQAIEEHQHHGEEAMEDIII